MMWSTWVRLLTLLLLVAAGGCRKSAPPSPPPSQKIEPPKLVVSKDSPLLYTYVEAKGAFATTDKAEDVPQNARRLVRVVDPSKAANDRQDPTKVYAVDLVREQLRIARGLPMSVQAGTLSPRGWSIECRITSEDPANGLLQGFNGSQPPVLSAGLRPQIVSGHRVPGWHVYAVGDVSDGHLVFRPAGKKRREQVTAHRPVQAAHAVDGTAPADRQICHVEAL